MSSVFTVDPRGNCGRSDESSASSETPAGRDPRLDEAVYGLRSRTPELSAATGLWSWQRHSLAVMLVALCLGAAVASETALIALLAIMAGPFLCVVILRTVALWQLRRRLPDGAAPIDVTQSCRSTVSWFPCSGRRELFRSCSRLCAPSTTQPTVWR